MGNDWEYRNDGRRIGYIVVGGQCNAVFDGSFLVQCWIQRVLQRVIANFVVSNELNIPGINTNGSGNRLGIGPNPDRLHLHLDIKLAFNLLLHVDPSDNSDILRAQIHAIIATFPGRKAPIRRGQKSHITNRPDQLQHDRCIRSEIVTGLQIKDRGL